MRARFNKRWLALLGSLLIWGNASALETGFLDRRIRVEGAEYRYQVYVPAEYSKARAWPVMVFLHGSGESGRDGLVQTEVGLGTALRRHPQRYPAIAIFPQTPTSSSGHALTAKISMAMLDRTQAEFKTDKARVYLTGLSMGGSGAIYLAHRHPERFAALVAICGWVAKPGSEMDRIERQNIDRGLLDTTAQRLAKLPVWLFHGDADTAVPVEQSRELFNALQRAGAPAKYTEIPGGSHNAWDPAYLGEEMPAWLFAQHK